MKQVLTCIISFGVILTLISVIVPEGRMKKTSCRALSFIMTLFLVTFFASFNFKGIKESERTYVYSEKDNQELLLKFACDKILKSEKVYAEEIVFETAEDNFIFSINSIKVKNPTDENGNEAKDKAVKIICEYFNVEKEKVLVYE